jgi:urease accessory protein
MNKQEGRMNVLGLVQLCQCVQPGGYGYALGLERLARTGQIHSPAQLAALVNGVLRARIGPAEGVAAGIAFRAARRGDYDCLPGLGDTLSARQQPELLRLASVHMGQRLWGVSRQWDWAGGLHQQLDDLTRHTDLHHAMAFGTLVSETTSSQIRAIATFLFNTARSIILAAIRAIPLDDAAGQRVLAEVQPTITAVAAACADKDATDIIVPPGDPLRGIFP